MWHFWQNKIIFLVYRRKNQISPFFVSLEKWWWLHLKTILPTLMVDDMQQWVHRVVYEGKPRQTCNAEMCKNNFPQGRIMLWILILRQVYDSIHPHTYSESENRVTLQKEQRTFHVMLVDLLCHGSLNHTAIGPFARCHPYNHFFQLLLRDDHSMENLLVVRPTYC